jgi:hypothetical protein
VTAAVPCQTTEATDLYREIVVALLPRLLFADKGTVRNIADQLVTHGTTVSSPETPEDRGPDLPVTRSTHHDPHLPNDGGLADPRIVILAARLGSAVMTTGFEILETSERDVQAHRNIQGGPAPVKRNRGRGA